MLLLLLLIRAPRMLLLQVLLDPALSRAISSRYRQDRGATVLEVRAARRCAHMATSATPLGTVYSSLLRVSWRLGYVYELPCVANLLGSSYHLHVVSCTHSAR